jgi:hypothetical protein
MLHIFYLILYILQRGLVSEFDKNYVEAKDCFEGATALDPNSLRGLQQLVSSLRENLKKKKLKMFSGKSVLRLGQK